MALRAAVLLPRSMRLTSTYPTHSPNQRTRTVIDSAASCPCDESRSASGDVGESGSAVLMRVGETSKEEAPHGGAPSPFDYTPRSEVGHSRRATVGGDDGWLGRSH